MAKNFLFGKIFFYLAQFFLCLFKNSFYLWPKIIKNFHRCPQTLLPKCVTAVLKPQGGSTKAPQKALEKPPVAPMLLENRCW
jgi:hypothetical protein